MNQSEIGGHGGHEEPARHRRAAGGLRLRRLLQAVRHRLAHAGAAGLSRHAGRAGYSSDALYARQRDAGAVRRFY